MRSFFCFLFICFSLNLFPYDTAEARKIIKKLCSPKLHGRGYYRKGVHKAARFLIKELKKNNMKPLFGKDYSMEFAHPVNIFEDDPVLEINGKKLIPGKEFVLDPSFPKFSLDTTFDLPVMPSRKVTGKGIGFRLKFTSKLTWGVSTSWSDDPEVQILKGASDTIIRSIRLINPARLEPEFKEYIVGGYTDGGSNDSMIVFCAHYDHLGRMGPSSLFAGANDNASGTCMVTMLMRYFNPVKKQLPRYRLVFIYFPAEEAGLLGSRFFNDYPPIDLKKIKFLINFDLLGSGEEGMMVVNATEFKREFELLQSLNRQYGRVKEIRSRGPAANSDHYWFYKNGVPCFFIYTLGGKPYYHDVNDLPAALSLYAFNDIFNLIISFIRQL